MADEKIVTVNIRKDLLKVSKWRRGNRALPAITKTLEKMYKNQRIIIGKTLNEGIWKRGLENPPSKLKLKVSKVDDKTVKVEMEKS